MIEGRTDEGVCPSALRPLSLHHQQQEQGAEAQLATAHAAWPSAGSR